MIRGGQATRKIHPKWWNSEQFVLSAWLVTGKQADVPLNFRKGLRKRVFLVVFSGFGVEALAFRKQYRVDAVAKGIAKSQKKQRPEPEPPVLICLVVDPSCVLLQDYLDAMHQYLVIWGCGCLKLKRSRTIPPLPWRKYDLEAGYPPNKSSISSVGVPPMGVQEMGV